MRTPPLHTWNRMGCQVESGRPSSCASCRPALAARSRRDHPRMRQSFSTRVVPTPPPECRAHPLDRRVLITARVTRIT
jgi:hypothetical protein